jgi:hypothetical protein
MKMLPNILKKQLNYNQKMLTGGITFLLFRNYVAHLYIEKGDLNAAKRHLDESLRL